MICLHNFLGGEIEHDLTQFAVFRLCNESTGCGEMGDCLPHKPHKQTQWYTLYVSLTWIKIGFEYIYLIGIFFKMSHLNVKQLFYISISIYFSIIHIKKYVL